MNKLFMISLIIFLTLFCFINVKGETLDSNTSGSQVTTTENTDLNQLYNYISKIGNDYDALKTINVRDYIQKASKGEKGNISLSNLVQAFVSYGFRELAYSMKLMGMIIIIAVICALMNNLQRAFSDNKVADVAYFACYSLIIVLIAKNFYLGVDCIKVAINQISDLMASLLPIIMTLLISVGGISQAATLDPIILASTNIGVALFENIILPLILFSFVLQFVNNLHEEFKLERLSKLLNSLALWGQGIIMTVFIAIMTIRGISAQTIDLVTVKTTKFAVDNFVPVVGKLLSDAVTTVAGYSLLLKNAVSVLGLILMLIIVLYPIIKVLILALIFKFTAAILEPICNKQLVNAISSSGDSLVLVTSCLISISVMFFIMIAILATAGRMVVGG
ncbi:MAG TPA: stage III sporulation protein AE [Clostridiaceae bacterium]